MDAFKPSIVVMSAPLGGGIIDPLIMMIPMFTKLPKSAPDMTAKIFLTAGLINILNTRFIKCSITKVNINMAVFDSRP